jgi:hypothetical protein
MLRVNELRAFQNAPMCRLGTCAASLHIDANSLMHSAVEEVGSQGHTWEVSGVGSLVC